MQKPIKLSDLSDAQKDKLFDVIRKVCIELALAEVCFYLGHRDISDQQRKDLVEMLTRNLENPDPARALVEWKSAKKLRKSVLQLAMSELTLRRGDADHG